jgi:hypothetical protein
MRLLITILAIAILSGIAEWTTHIWWTAAFVAGLAGLLSRMRTGEAALAGFWGIALLWLSFSLFLDLRNDHLFSQKMAKVFNLPSYILYIVITFILGGIIGALPAWAGAHLRKMFRPESFATVD